MIKIINKICNLAKIHNAMSYLFDEKTYNHLRHVSLRAYELTNKEITTEQAQEIIKLIKKTETIAQQDTLIIKYLM